MTLVSSSALWAFGLLTAAVLLTTCGDRSFDATAWKDARVVDERARYGMAEDLREKHLVKGTSRARVLELLGRPDFEDADRGCLEYSVGCGFGDVDTYVLHIWFADDRVMDTQVRE